MHPTTEHDGDEPDRWTFRPPSLRDPRLHVASVLLSVQLLGQVSLGFELSVAQILVSLGTAAVIELLLTAPRTKVVAWPASALLSGNGVALILRVPGTEHGDWWSLHGWYVFAATSALAVLSKYVIRWAGRPLFNPSNIALVVAFLLLGSGLADPQDLWWGHMSVGLALTYALILVGGVAITRRLQLLGMSIVFWTTFAACMAVVAVAGHSMTARWNLGPVAGWQYWTTLALSPEVLIFLFFMITDPRTGARGRTAGILYGAAVAATSSVLIAFQTTEYATKVALLSGLVLVCAGRPIIESWAPAGAADSPRRWWSERPGRRVAVLGTSAAALGLILTGATFAEPPAPPIGAERPAVELRDDQRPRAVELGDGLAGVGGSFGQDDADRVARDVVEAVLVVDRAIEAGDADLAATAATGPFLRSVRDRASVPAPDRRIDTAAVDVVRDPDEFQAQPRLAVTLEGSVDGRPWSSTYHVLATTADARIEREVPAD
ncbi:MAG: hypothetical protein ACYC2O_10225 [Microthrixaceae bacterium]